MPPNDRDLELRQAAVAAARGHRVRFGSFQKGVHRSRIQQGPAALTLTTSVRDPYADRFDAAGGRFSLAYRAGAADQPESCAPIGLRAPSAARVLPGAAPSQYLVVARCS